MIAFLRNQLQVATKNQTAQNNQNLFFMPNTSIFHYDYYHQPTNFIPSDSSIPQPQSRISQGAFAKKEPCQMFVSLSESPM